MFFFVLLLRVFVGFLSSFSWFCLFGNFHTQYLDLLKTQKEGKQQPGLQSNEEHIYNYR